MKLKSLLINLTVTAVSLVIGLVLAEGAARVALNPADYLSVELRDDPVLGAKPFRETASGAFDSWGFRNTGVPASADIVAIGDSHTYGNTATMAQSWPHVLAGLTGQRVYNMGLGGYGPNQYAHLLSKALSLKPKLVVVGLYMGDDFENAFLITYGLEYWSRLRTLPADKVNFDIWARPPAAVSFQKSVRIWLSRHSVVYQLVVHGPLLGRVQGEAQIRNASQLFPDAATALELPDDGILEAFRPKGLLLNLDQDSANVNEGMRITIQLLEEMQQQCREQGAQFLVAVVPTKEMVFSDLFAKQPGMPLAGTIASLLAHESKAREKTFDSLRRAGIEVVDTLPALRAARRDQLYARTAGDMHPNGNGYRVIAHVVAPAAKRSMEQARPQKEPARP